MYELITTMALTMIGVAFTIAFCIIGVVLTKGIMEGMK